MNGVIQNGPLQRLPIAALAIALALAAAVACGAPVGQEAFRHDFGGEIYVFVEYGEDGDELAIFSGSGRPVSAKRDADAALRSYVWTRAFDAADMSVLAQAADRVSELDSDIANVRSASNAIIRGLDELDGMSASVPLMGRVSAMDLVESEYPGVDALGGAMRDLDSKLNDWGADTKNLRDAAVNLQMQSLSQHPDADEVEGAFGSANSAAGGLANTIGEIESSLDNARDDVWQLRYALRSASKTPVIGDAIESLSNDIGGAADIALSNLAANLEKLKADLSSVSTSFGQGAAQAETTYLDYSARWMEDPPDASWPPTDPERRSPPRPEPTARTANVIAPTPEPTAPVPATNGPIAFLSKRYTGFFGIAEESWAMYVMNADGSDVTLLTTDGPQRPSWSPDGSRIAYATRNAIRVMNADGSDNTRLAGADAGSLSWSPDGSRIAFVAEYRRNYDIYVMNADGSARARLTNDSAREWDLSWSPDGSRIAFTSDKIGDGQIYVMNADGSGVRRLTDNFDRIYGNPSWSPDGSRIAFSSGSERRIITGYRNWDIYVMTAGGSRVTRLTDDSAVDVNPSWSPDGSLIAFASKRDGNHEIYVMNADGSGVTRLTNNPADDVHPSWGRSSARVESGAP